MSTAKSRGRWTKEEHARYLKAVDMYGTNYDMLESYIKTRTKTQIRTHHKAYSLRTYKGAASPAEKSKSLKSFKEAVSKKKSAAPKKSKGAKAPSKGKKKAAGSSKKKKVAAKESSGFSLFAFAKKLFGM